MHTHKLHLCTCINAYTYTPGAVIPPGFHWPKETGPGDGVSLLHLLSDLTALPDADLGKQTAEEIRR